MSDGPRGRGYNASLHCGFLLCTEGDLREVSWLCLIIFYP